MFDKKNKIMRDFIDNTKRIRIDYKNIKDYKEPFVMTLKIKGKRKLDVWTVKNGQEAETIREEYKRKNRYTSYVDFYKNIDDLLEEQNIETLQLNPRIRGKNIKSEKEENFETKKTTVDLGNLYEQLMRTFETHEKIEEHVKKLIKKDYEETLSEYIEFIKKL